MPNTRPDFQHAARTAALRVEKMVIDMLTNQEVGEVAVIISWGQLEPEKRVFTKAKLIKVGRGGFEPLETTP